MASVEFTFDINNKVITPFQEDGIVRMLGFDLEGKKYYVQTKDTSCWFLESELVVYIEVKDNK